VGLAGILKLSKLDVGTDGGWWVVPGGGSPFQKVCPGWEAASLSPAAWSGGTHGEMP